MVSDKPSWDRDAWFDSLDVTTRHTFVFCRAWDEWLALLDDGGREYVSWLWEAFTELGHPDPKELIVQEVAFNWPALASAHVLHNLWGDIEASASPTVHNADAQALLAAGADPVALSRLVRTSIVEVMSSFFYNLDAGLNHDLWDDRFPGWALMETDITGMIARPTDEDPDDIDTLTGRKVNIRDYFGPVTPDQIERDKSQGAE
jgi:hypothetical protein